MYNTLSNIRHLIKNQEMGPTYLSPKGQLSFQAESLLSMAIYDLENGGSHREFDPLPTNLSNRFAFHPVDEYKDLSVRELLELSDCFLLGDDDDSDESLVNPTSLDIPSSRNVVSGHTFGSKEIVEPICSTSIGLFDSILQDRTPNTNIFVDSERHLSGSKRSTEATNENYEQLNIDTRFRPYQTDQWSERFYDLVKYQESTGNCLVPHTYRANLPLARWVKRQRYQYKLMIEGRSSTMTEERVKALEEIGFVWDSQGAAWFDKLEELHAFKRLYLHCNVPSNYSANPQLATWVKCQRRQYKLYVEGKTSNMTPERIQHLDSMGFEWLLRPFKKARVS